jgi:hypothetical protein
MSLEREAKIDSGKVVPLQRVEADKKRQDTESLPTGNAQPVDRVKCRAGDQSCAAAHASSLSRATSSRPALAKESLLQLQRQYGNRYVERVLSLSQEAAQQDPTHTPGHVEAAIESQRGGGQHLDNGVRRQMEGAMGADLSGVRVHTECASLHHGPGHFLQPRSLSARQFHRPGAYCP